MTSHKYSHMDERFRAETFNDLLHYVGEYRYQMSADDTVATALDRICEMIRRMKYGE